MAAPVGLLPDSQYLHTDRALALFLIFITITAYYLRSRMTKDPYGLFHLSLNKISSEDPNAPPTSEWLNMGFWKDTDIFPQACSALAIKLCHSARCATGDRILDVGHGTGESLLLLLSSTSIPRPSSITGITSLRVHHLRAQKRVAEFCASSEVSMPIVHLYEGDAVYHETDTKDKPPSHPLDPSSTDVFDAVLALDCAYHFNTRKTFLRQSFHKLAPGGRVALADICFDPRKLRNAFIWTMTFLFKVMPRHNLVSIEGYASQMEEIGFVEVQVEDISIDVFPGFVKFLKSRGLGWRVFGCVLEWYANAGAQFVLAVYIRGYEDRPFPKPHAVYRIEIQAQVRSWQMWRRYSEFDDLHTELTKSVGSPPPCPLPPKHKFSLVRSRLEPKMLEERRIGLEDYLRAIIAAKEDKWRESYVMKEFLGVPVSRQGGAPPEQFTSGTWLDEHAELQTRIRAVRADINKRDALTDHGDVGGSHKANLNAKTKLAGLSARIDTLEKGLQELGWHGISEGELQRRLDMIARLRDDQEKLTRMVTIARHNSSRADGDAQNKPSYESDREALLGTGVLKPITRVFGALKETEQTRPLDDHGLIGLQQAQIQQQDEQLSQLTTILRRQKQLGVAIANEIGQQNEILDTLSNEVDTAGGKLTVANRQLNKLG